MFDKKEEPKKMINGWRAKAELHDLLDLVIKKTESEFGDRFIKAVFMDEVLRLGLKELLNDVNDRTEEKPVVANKPKKAPVKRFVKPTVDEVCAFMLKQTGIPAISKNESEKFVDYYQGNGWLTGKNPVKDWEATARNWLRRSVKDAVNNADRLATPDRTAMKAARSGQQVPEIEQGAIEGVLL